MLLSILEKPCIKCGTVNRSLANGRCLTCQHSWAKVNREETKEEIKEYTHTPIWHLGVKKRSERNVAAGNCRRHPLIPVKSGRTACQLCLWKAIECKFKSIYKIDLEDYARMWWAQHGLCAICKIWSKDLVIDHCHVTTKVRKLLCNECNGGLGFFKDSLQLLNQAAVYLQGV